MCEGSLKALSPNWWWWIQSSPFLFLSGLFFTPWSSICIDREATLRCVAAHSTWESVFVLAGDDWWLLSCFPRSWLAVIIYFYWLWGHIDMSDALLDWKKKMLLISHVIEAFPPLSLPFSFPTNTSAVRNNNRCCASFIDVSSHLLMWIDLFKS